MVDQTSQFYAILTNVGAAKQANADALGIPWTFTHMAVGDGNPAGLENPPHPMPVATQTALLNEWRRAPLNQLKVDPNNPAIIIAEQIIPADEGGKWIRELALFDAAGDMVAVANCPPTFKPLLSQGSGRTQVVRLNLIVSSSSNVQLKIDPSVVLATREWVTEELAKQDFKHSVVAASTGPVTLSGLQTVDGVALTAGARVLVKNQAAAKDNGLYQVVAGGAWTRSLDGDTSAKVTPGMLVLVERGTVNADSAWQLVTDAPITLGVTALTYEMAFGRTGVAAGTYRSVTVDAYGRVTAASNPTTVAGYGLTDVYTKTELDQALALKAPLASPAFTGAPTVPTPEQGNNSTQAANTAFVQTTIAALIASAPGALDTLNELAAALGNDPNFATTVTNALAQKAPLVSPELSGAPTAPTAARFDSSALIANTAFVKSQMGSFNGSATITNNTVLDASYIGKRIEITNGAVLVTLPATGSVPVGSTLLITTSATNGVQLTVPPDGTVLAFNNYAIPTPYTMSASGDVLLISDGTTWRGHMGSECLRNSPLFAAALTAEGYEKLPSGKIRQWGSAMLPSNGTLEITLPLSFKEQIFGVICQYTTGLAGVAGRCGGEPLSLTKIRLESCIPGLSAQQNIYWEAYGK